MFFSLIALAASGFVFLQTYDDGRLGRKLKENVGLARKEIDKAIESRGDHAGKSGSGKAVSDREADSAADKSGTDADPKSSDKADAAAADGGSIFNLDRVRGRVDEVRELAAKSAPEARRRLDSLREELLTIRDYGTKKRDAVLEKSISAIEDAKGYLDMDKDEAKAKLKALSEDLAKQAARVHKPEVKSEAGAEPEANFKWSGDSAPRTQRRGAEPPPAAEN